MKTISIFPSDFKTTAIRIFIFAVAMALLEAAVVVYLRMLFFPSHFDLPQLKVPPLVMTVELSREFATILMLVCIGNIAGRDKAEKFAWFIISFAIWDIFYYVFLYAFLQWPASILGWDILFLIPVPWYGPVLSPIIVSLSMILFGICILYAGTFRYRTFTSIKEKLLLLTGGFVILVTYTYDFIRFSMSTKDGLKYDFSKYIPEYYNWPMFIAGLSLISIALFSFYHRIRKSDNTIIKAMY